MSCNFLATESTRDCIIHSFVMTKHFLNAIRGSIFQASEDNFQIYFISIIQTSYCNILVCKDVHLYTLWEKPVCCNSITPHTDIGICSNAIRRILLAKFCYEKKKQVSRQKRFTGFLKNGQTQKIPLLLHPYIKPEWKVSNPTQIVSILWFGIIQNERHISGIHVSFDSGPRPSRLWTTNNGNVLGFCVLFFN